MSQQLNRTALTRSVSSDSRGTGQVTIDVVHRRNSDLTSSQNFSGMKGDGNSSGVAGAAVSQIPISTESRVEGTKVQGGIPNSDLKTRVEEVVADVRKQKDKVKLLFNCTNNILYPRTRYSIVETKKQKEITEVIKYV